MQQTHRGGYRTVFNSTTYVRMNNFISTVHVELQTIQYFFYDSHRTIMLIRSTLFPLLSGTICSIFLLDYFEFEGEVDEINEAIREENRHCPLHVG